jgi:hypothetical protein
MEHFQIFVEKNININIALAAWRSHHRIRPRNRRSRVRIPQELKAERYRVMMSLVVDFLYFKKFQEMMVKGKKNYCHRIFKK